MKINPTAIQSYQQLGQRPTHRPAEQQKQAEMLERGVTITPQANETRSELAIKAPEGSYADFLTDGEKAALDLLFQRFGDSGRFGSAFAGDGGESGATKTLGKLIDVKV